MRPLILICGKQGSGKTTFGRILSYWMDAKMGDTSSVVVRAEVDRRRRLGLVPESFAWDKERDRPARSYLASMGDAMKRVNPLVLVDALVHAGSQVIVGVRGREELAAIRRKYPHTTVFWVNRRDAADDPDDNCQISSTDADHVIQNNSTLAWLDLQAKRVSVGLRMPIE